MGEINRGSGLRKLFIITFEYKEEMDLVLGKKEEAVGEEVMAIRKWNEEECCNKRCVWTEVSGIPPLPWCRDNKEKVVEPIGDVLWIDKSTLEGKSMASGKILVQTEVMSFLEDHLCLEVENKNFEIYVKELDCYDDWKPKKKRISPALDSPVCSFVPTTAMDEVACAPNNEDDEVAKQLALSHVALIENGLEKEKVGIEEGGTFFKSHYDRGMGNDDAANEMFNGQRSDEEFLGVDSHNEKNW